MKNGNALKITLLLSSMMTILANAIIAPALPEINKAFASQPNAEILSKLIMTLPALTIAIFATTIGIVIDKYGRVRVLLISLLVFAMAGTSGLWLNYLISILVGRFFLGFGVAGIMTASTTLIGDYFKGSQRNQFISLQGAFSGFGGLIFITLAGYLTDVNWRYTFAIYSFSIVVFLLAITFLKEQKEGNNFQSEEKVLMESSNFKYIYLIYATAFIGIILFYILPLQIPFYLKNLQNVTNSMTGWAIGALTTSQAIASFFYGKLKVKFKYASIYGISFGVMALGYALISFGGSYWQILIGLIISGIGVAWMMPNSTLWIMELTPESKRGSYIGKLTTFIFLGIFASPIIVQPLQNAFGLKNTFFYLSMFLFGLAILYTVTNLKKTKSTI